MPRFKGAVGALEMCTYHATLEPPAVYDTWYVTALVLVLVQFFRVFCASSTRFLLSIVELLEMWEFLVLCGFEQKFFAALYPKPVFIIFLSAALGVGALCKPTLLHLVHATS